MGHVTFSAIPALCAEDVTAYLESLCDTGILLVCNQAQDGTWYSLRLIPGESAGYRIFKHNNGALVPFSSLMPSRADAGAVYEDILIF